MPMTVSVYKIPREAGRVPDAAGRPPQAELLGHLHTPVLPMIGDALIMKRGTEQTEVRVIERILAAEATSLIISDQPPEFELIEVSLLVG